MPVTKCVRSNATLMKDWDWERNAPIGYDPDTISQGSHKMVWWVCSRGHSYAATAKNRVAGTGCPYCAGKKVLIGFNDLGTRYPQVAKDWHCEMNGEQTPSTVTFGSNKKVWWKCEVCNGVYETQIANRTLRGSSCPYCAHQKVLTGYNDLQTLFPELSAEWSEHNTCLPSEVSPYSKKKVLWKCALGHAEYLMAIQQRTNRQGCPVCAKQSQTSFPEQAIYFYLQQVFPDSVNRYMVDHYEIDIYIPSRRIGIEYNGYFSHREKAERDAQKRRYAESKGITLITIKEYKLTEERMGADLYVHERTTFKDLDVLIRSLLSYFDEVLVDIDCRRDVIAIKSQYMIRKKEKSIATVRPDLVSRWDYEKNGAITPDMVSIGSGIQYYWKCRICNRSYLAFPKTIADGSVCSHHRNLLKKGVNDLETLHPELLKYWDYEKNAIQPSDIFGGGEKVAFWICERGHSYTKSILKRSRGEGCPICAGKKVLIGYNDLATVAPDVAESWNYSRNGNLLPTQVVSRSNKLVWWKCEHGHEWQARVNDRTRGTGCPRCYQAKRGKRQINLYDSDNLVLLGAFDSVKALCEYLRLDYEKLNGTISRVCNRKQKTLMGKYVVRNANDDEYAGSKDSMNNTGEAAIAEAKEFRP